MWFFFVEKRIFEEKKLSSIMPPIRRGRARGELPSWMQRIPRHVAPRWARIFFYGINRARYLRDLAVVPPPPPPKTIDDLPTEILVKIFWFVLSARHGEYNVALPRVCSRWTRVMYDFVYVQGFGVEDYSDLLGREATVVICRQGGPIRL